MDIHFFLSAPFIYAWKSTSVKWKQNRQGPDNNLCFISDCRQMLARLGQSQAPPRIASPSTRPGRLPARTGTGRSLWPTAAWGRGWGSPTGGRAPRPRASGWWWARPVSWRLSSYRDPEPTFLLTEKSTRMSHLLGKLSVNSSGVSVYSRFYGKWGANKSESFKSLL